MSIVPVRDIYEGSRLPEHGRIKFGEKYQTANGKTAMRVIPKFRLTSPDRKVIEQAASLWGGEPKAWHDERANPQDQFEVYTKVDSLRVFLPPNSLSTWYEMWSGGGIVRRCDGVTVTMAGQHGDVDRPCICTAAEKLDCKPTTRLTVILPELTFGGGWRLETKSWHALREMPTMQRMIEQLQTVGIVEARLSLQKQTNMKNGRRQHFTVPKLTVDTTPLEMLEGAGRVQALAQGEQLLGLPQATGGPDPDELDWFERETGPLKVEEHHDADDDIVDAEIVGDGGGPSGDTGREIAPPLLTSVTDSSSGGGSPTPGGEPETGPSEAQPTAGEVLAERATRRATNPKRTKFVLEVKKLAALMEMTDEQETELRHAIVWRVNHTKSSTNDLDDAELSAAIDFALAYQADLDKPIRLLDAYRQEKP